MAQFTAALKSWVSATFATLADARLTDARTPTAHAASHGTGQADAITPGAIGAAAALGVDDNYVTDAEKVKLTNLSGTNTGDQTLPTWATIDKPAVVAAGATQAAARDSLGLGTAALAAATAFVAGGDRAPGTNVVISGCYPTTSATLTATISAGVAYVGGVRVVVAATAQTFAASSDTYLDLSSAGAYTLVPVANGAAIPAVTAGCLRVAKVVTSAAAITAVVNTSTNVAIGNSALSVGGMSWGSVAIGHEALMNNNPNITTDTGLYNTAVGYRALRGNVTGDHCTAVGWSALAAQTAGIGNTAIGEDALLALTTANDNTAIGTHAAYQATTAPRSVAIGGMALGNLTTGPNNVAVGMSSGIATYAGVGSCTTDDSMTFLGTYSSVDKSVNAGPFQNSTALGARAKVDDSNLIQLGSSAVTKVRTAGDYESTATAGGIILKSPDGTRYRITVANGGTLVVAPA